MRRFCDLSRNPVELRRFGSVDGAQCGQNRDARGNQCDGRRADGYRRKPTEFVPFQRKRGKKRYGLNTDKLETAGDDEDQSSKAGTTESCKEGRDQIVALEGARN